MDESTRRIGRYEIRRELGRGMMGVVYEALDPLLGRTVALKTIHLAFSVSAEERQSFEKRFFSEARAVAKLSHPAIVGVHDIGQDPETGSLFMALEYLRGQTLAEVVYGKELLPWRETLRIVGQLASGLDHAHAHAVVHRDVKPENIMLLESGQPKLMDFGIAKLEAGQLTVAGQLFGTPRYMAPEQALGDQVDGRSDLFALGAVAYVMLTGRQAFEAPTVAAILRQVLNDDPAPPSTLVPGLPADIDHLVARMVAKGPTDRYQTGRQIVEDVDDILAARSPRHRPAAPPLRVGSGTVVAPGGIESLLDELELEPPAAAADPPTAAVREPAPTGPTPMPTPAAAPISHPERSRSKHAVLAGLAVAGLIAVAAMLLRSGDSPRDRAAPRQPLTNASTAPDAPSGGEAERPPAASNGPVAVAFELEHSLRSGRVRVWVDDELALEEPVSGRQTKKLGVLKQSKGRFDHALQVAEGEHTIRVEVAWDDERKAKSVTATFSASRPRRLEARLVGVGGFARILSLDLD